MSGQYYGAGAQIPNTYYSGIGGSTNSRGPAGGPGGYPGQYASTGYGASQPRLFSGASSMGSQFGDQFGIGSRQSNFGPPQSADPFASFAARGPDFAQASTWDRPGVLNQFEDPRNFRTTSTSFSAPRTSQTGYGSNRFQTAPAAPLRQQTAPGSYSSQYTSRTAPSAAPVYRQVAPTRQTAPADYRQVAPADYRQAAPADFRQQYETPNMSLYGDNTRPGTSSQQTSF